MERARHLAACGAGAGLMSTARRIACVLTICAVAIVSVASAQPRRNAPPSVIGAWRFETARYDGGAGGGCQMSGTMTIARAAAPNTFACTFIATESCGVNRWSAEQRCTATRSGDKLEITSEIVRLSPANTSYAPDNWSMSIRSSDLMVGELRSADIADVQFRRGPAFVS